MVAARTLAVVALVVGVGVPTLYAANPGGRSDLWPDSFVEGLAPLRGVGPLPPAAQCAACHVEIAAQWRASRHAHSATNDLFVDGFRAEPHPRCIACHAPRPESRAPLVQALPSGVVDDAGGAHDGIDCATCHVRDGVVLTAGGARGYGHPVERTPELAESVFCARCHEFSSHASVGGVTHLTELPLQTTFSEWRRYRDQGGAGTCQSCHMPGGAHTFWGGNHLPTLRGGLHLSLQRDGDDVVATVATAGVGHHVPTGDAFRRLTLTALTPRGPQLLATFARRVGLRERDDGTLEQVVLDDTTLVPGAPARVVVPAAATAVVLDYHRADEAAVRRGRVPLNELKSEVARVLVRP